MPTEPKAYILGVGLTKFAKPQSATDYADLGEEAGIKALLDARLSYDDIERGIACYCYGDSTSGQRVFYRFGMTRIPIYNVNNNCATGSTGVCMGADFVRSGAAHCVMVVGFEKMAPGSLQSYFTDRVSPLETAAAINRTAFPAHTKAAFAPQLFGNAAKEYMQRYGATAGDFAEVARVNHAHSARNPYAQFRTAYSYEQVAGSAEIFWPLTKLQCCPTSDGAGAAIIVSESFLNARPELWERAVEIAGQCLATDSPISFDETAMNLVGYDATQHAAQVALAQSRLGIQDIKVIELHDCFSTNEILVINSIGLAPHGKAHEYVRSGQATFGSKAAVVNPSGGLISKGHPLGATGLAQISELVWHLRGWANNRFVSVDAGKGALQQNAGLGSAIVVSLLKRADGKANRKLSSTEVVQQSGVGYNPAVEAKGFTREQAERVKSKRRNKWAERKASVVGSEAQL